MPWLTLKWKRKETRLAVTQKERETEFSPFHNYFFSRNSIRGKICLTMEAELIKTWESFSQHWLLSENPPPPKNYLQFGSFFFRRFFLHIATLSVLTIKVESPVHSPVSRNASSSFWSLFHWKVFSKPIFSVPENLINFHCKPKMTCAFKIRTRKFDPIFNSFILLGKMMEKASDGII